MKKLILFLILCLIAVPAFADEMIEYTFHNGEYSILLPSFFAVIDENADPVDLEFLEKSNCDLFACMDNFNRFLTIQVFDDAFDDVYELLTWDDAKFIGDTWSEKLEEVDYNTLFVEPYLNGYDCFGKVFYTGVSDEGTNYYVDYLAAYGTDLVVISAWSNDTQFNVQEDHMLNLCADTLSCRFVTVYK